MPKQKLEIECPVCDAKLSIDARSCPKCGADLGMADFQDLERLANDISNGSTSPEEPERHTSSETEHGSEDSGEVVPEKEQTDPEKEAPIPAETPSTPEIKKEEGTEAEAPEGSGKKKGLFSKFFGKKK